MNQPIEVQHKFSRIVQIKDGKFVFKQVSNDKWSSDQVFSQMIFLEVNFVIDSISYDEL